MKQIETYDKLIRISKIKPGKKQTTNRISRSIKQNRKLNEYTP